MATHVCVQAPGDGPSWAQTSRSINPGTRHVRTGGLGRWHFSVVWVSPALNSSQRRPRYQGDASHPCWALSRLSTHRIYEHSKNGCCSTRLSLRWPSYSNRLPGQYPWLCAQGMVLHSSSMRLYGAQLKWNQSTWKDCLFLWDSLQSSEWGILKGNSLSANSFTSSSLCNGFGYHLT